jgi:hypothetical protein
MSGRYVCVVDAPDVKAVILYRHNPTMLNRSAIREVGCVRPSCIISGIRRNTEGNYDLTCNSSVPLKNGVTFSIIFERVAVAQDAGLREKTSWLN